MVSRKHYRGIAFFSIILAVGLLIGCNLPIAPTPAGESTSVTTIEMLVTEAVTDINTASPTQESPKQATQTTTETVPPTPTLQNITFSVGPDQALVYPPGLGVVPDEHITIIPSVPGSDPYLVFVADMRNGKGQSGPVVLETKDLKTFTFAVGYSSPVMTAPYSLTTCKSSFDPEFDLNYASPGSVMQDPTRPAGNLIMIYEAENHCPGGVTQHYFYATVGFARSPDNGKTWPQPVDSELGGPERYPVLKGSTSEPTVAETNPVHMGDALPSAFVDKKYLYVTYLFAGPRGDGLIRVARARLGVSGKLNFLKWYNGAFSEPGIGGLDSGVLPSAGCLQQNMAQISYNDTFGLYMMTFVCKLQGDQAAWSFSTATSLDRQDWTVPQIIENSQFPLTSPCSDDGTGSSFDGWYPSFMSPGSAAGHISQTGFVFFMNGCNTWKRTFMSRAFTITGP